ncbi:MAG TPA: transposase [bacterium]|nr:transposase [bacterium]
MALPLDGKTFADDEMVNALGVTLHGQKVILGFVQTATENTRVVAEFLRDLLERGVQAEQGLLVVIDGSKGLRRGAQEVFGEAAAVQRCTWHKRENVVAHLPRGPQAA